MHSLLVTLSAIAKITYKYRHFELTQKTEVSIEYTVQSVKNKFPSSFQLAHIQMELAVVLSRNSSCKIWIHRVEIICVNCRECYLNRVQANNNILLSSDDFWYSANIEIILS